MSSPAPLSFHPIRGALLVVAAVLVFAGMDTAAKYLAVQYPVPLILAARYVINTLLLVAIFAPRHGWEMIRTNNGRLVFLRACALAISSLCAGLALQLMPLAETISIIYLAPFGIVLLSGPLLKERVRFASWVATIAGFAGLLVIVRPGSGLSFAGIIFALLAAAGAVVYHMLSRSLAKTETTMAMLFHASFVGMIIYCAFLPWNLHVPVPGGLDLVLFIATGVMSFIGHFLFTVAYRQAPASLLAPVNYMHVAWATGLGWLVFNHIPDVLTFLGIGMVAAAGIGNALWTHFREPKSATAVMVEVAEP